MNGRSLDAKNGVRWPARAARRKTRQPGVASGCRYFFIMSWTLPALAASSNAFTDSACLPAL